MLYAGSRPQTHPFIAFILNIFQEEKIYLLPLRLFIGIGWIRAGLEKWLEPGWFDGSSLSLFLTTHVAEGTIVFPFYQQLVLTVFEPSAQSLGIIIMVSQLLVGLAIITGAFTNLALISGIFMNINFILVGETVPSTFYIIMQLVLMLSHIGTIGIDGLLSKRVNFCFFVSKPSSRNYSIFEKTFIGITIALLSITAIMLIPYIESFDPSSVHDPAMVLFILSLFAAAFFSLSLLQSYLKPLQRTEPRSLKFM